MSIFITIRLLQFCFAHKSKLVCTKPSHIKVAVPTKFHLQGRNNRSNRSNCYKRSVYMSLRQICVLETSLLGGIRDLIQAWNDNTSAVLDLVLDWNRYHALMSPYCHGITSVSVLAICVYQGSHDPLVTNITPSVIVSLEWYMLLNLLKAKIIQRKYFNSSLMIQNLKKQLHCCFNFASQFSTVFSRPYLYEVFINEV